MAPTGDPLDYETVLHRVADRAYNFAFRLCGNDQDAQDLVQEAFTRALKFQDRYDPNKPFESWLFRILQNIYIDSVRRYDFKHTLSLDGPPPTEERSSWTEILPGNDPEPLDLLAKSEDEKHLQKALNELPAHYRTAVVLHDIEQLSYEEISTLCGVPMGTVSSRIHQGRRMLKIFFKKIEQGKMVETNDAT